MAAAFSLLCRMLWLSSLSFDDTPTVTLELSTPRVAPDGLLFCGGNGASAVAVKSLQQGGGLWQLPSEEHELLGSAGWQAAPFFQQRSALAQQLQPAELVDARDVLSSGDAADGGLPQQLAQLQGSSSNSSHACVLLSGAWQAGTRYQLTLSALANPPPPETPPARPVPPPELWVAPLTYIKAGSSGNSINSSSRLAGIRFLVRGDRQGQLCGLSSRAAAVPMFSACGEAGDRGLVPAGSANVSACLDALRAAVAADASLASRLPFNLPPVANLTGPPPLPANSSCPRGWLLRIVSGVPAECIDCANAASQAGGCVCNPGWSSNLIGPSACGPRISPTGNASDAAQLAGQLCDAYASYYDALMQGRLADVLVASLYLPAFARQAAYLLDDAALRQANASFWAAYVRDERAPLSPSRQPGGIGPHCASCHHGRFVDIYSGQQVGVRDDRFQAVQTLRLIGYALASVGHPCRRLWDPEQPHAWLYGRAHARMCAAL